MEVIWAKNQQAFVYLSDINSRLWTQVFTPYPKYGHGTLDIIVSLNSTWSDIRHSPPLQLWTLCILCNEKGTLLVEGVSGITNFGHPYGQIQY
jgi:hypothetical protein